MEDVAEERARQAKLRSLAEQIAAYDRGYEGGQRRCPRCGQWQQYKGERSRELSFDCGTLAVARAYYVCASCRTPSYPLDEQLGLVEGKEQGRLREKLALLAVLAPYQQAPQVCQTRLGTERPASSLRRVVLREARHLAASGHQHLLPRREQERLYLQGDGHLCPTREERQSPEDQGYREAKVVLAFAERDVAAVSQDRHEILAKVLKAKITDSEAFRAVFEEVYRRAQGEHAAELNCARRWGALDLESGGGTRAARPPDPRLQSCQTLSVGSRQTHLRGRLSLCGPVGQRTRGPAAR